MNFDAAMIVSIECDLPFCPQLWDQLDDLISHFSIGRANPTDKDILFGSDCVSIRKCIDDS